MDYAVLMAVTDDYACCAASTIMSLRDNSPAVFGQSDFVIYQTNMCEVNKQVLTQICQGRASFPQAFTPEGSPWLEPLRRAPNCCRVEVGPMVSELGLEALQAFALLDNYRKVLWLETDVLVCRPLDQLMELDCEIAGIWGYKCPRGGAGPDLSAICCAILMTILISCCAGLLCCLETARGGVPLLLQHWLSGQLNIPLRHIS